MKRLLALLLSLQFVLPLSVWGQERPVAALGRVATLGDISDAQRGIIANRLESILAGSYELVSREQYERAEEAAFASLDLEKCTEDECIRKIQEILQVDRLFILQIIRDEGVTQLTLNLVTTESKRIKEGICENCNLVQLYGRIEEMASELVGEDLGQDRAIAAQPEPVVEGEDDGISIWWWVLGGLAVAAAAVSGGAEPAPTEETGSASYSW